MKDLAYTIAWAIRITSKWSMVIGMLVSATTIYGAMALAAKVLHHTKF